jgi:hypothetical protein
VAPALCDYRPSVIAGAASTGAGKAAAAGETAIRDSGFYTLVYNESGFTLLGSTLASTAATGTVGIITGAGGVLGTVGAVLMAPATLIAGGVALVGVGGLEAACYFTDERVTEYDAVLALMEHFAANHPEDRFALVRGMEGRNDDAILIWNARQGEQDRYLVSELYVVNGTLMHRRMGPNRNLGQITYVDLDADPAAPSETD